MECRKQLILTWRWMEDEGVANGDMDDAMPDNEAIDRWTSDLIEPARVEALDKLGENKLSSRLANAWVRSKLAH
jgi:hypothetical protein